MLGLWCKYEEVSFLITTRCSSQHIAVLVQPFQKPRYRDIAPGPPKNYPNPAVILTHVLELEPMVSPIKKDAVKKILRKTTLFNINTKFHRPK